MIEDCSCNTGGPGGSSDQRRDDGDSEKWLDSGYTGKVEPMGFSDRLHVSVREERVKDDSRVLARFSGQGT